MGGGIYLAIAIALIQLAGPLGIDGALAVRIGISGAGLWWAGFAWFALKRFRETGTPLPLPRPHRLAGVPRWRAILRLGFARTVATTRRLRQFPQLLLFVVAFMLFNDGVQTTINVSAVCASGTLELGSILLARVDVEEARASEERWTFEGV